MNKQFAYITVLLFFTVQLSAQVTKNTGTCYLDTYAQLIAFNPDIVSDCEWAEVTATGDFYRWDRPTNTWILSIPSTGIVTYDDQSDGITIVNDGVGTPFSTDPVGVANQIISNPTATNILGADFDDTADGVTIVGDGTNTPFETDPDGVATQIASSATATATLGAQFDDVGDGVYIINDGVASPFTLDLAKIAEDMAANPAVMAFFQAVLLDHLNTDQVQSNGNRNHTGNGEYHLKSAAGASLWQIDAPPGSPLPYMISIDY